MFLFCLQSTIQDEKNYQKKAIDIDETLFEKIAMNDKNAFETLYRLTDKIVFSFILTIVKNKDDAQDVMQDTYLKIRTAASLYKPQGKPLAWIFTIARNLSLMKLRAKKKTTIDFLDLENNIEYSNQINQDDKIVLNTLLNSLEEEERQIIMLHAVSGLKHKEIAETLNLPLSTALSKYHRALKKLKKLL